jgi:hypothetical protein
MKNYHLVFLGFIFILFSPVSSLADDTVPGAYAQQDQSVMGIGRTMMQMGARDRALTDAVNRASGAAMSRSSAAGVNIDYQFGQSQIDQSWKAQRTVEEASVRGLVVGDCQGDNSDDQYRKQMNQNRKGYSKEILISNKDCEVQHPTKSIEIDPYLNVGSSWGGSSGGSLGGNSSNGIGSGLSTGSGSRNKTSEQEVLTKAKCISLIKVHNLDWVLGKYPLCKKKLNQ